MSGDENTRAPGQGDVQRRNFLRTVALAGAGAATGVTAVAIGAEPEAAPESAADQIKGRYRESPHVERFYFLNRL